ncbi:hypothetical protein BDF22DRAFT_739467 [Syncephalis plumigaleata]|nr:hypothetical protein BDF22DRAFT_739467 [Syncephalis plumigaleata]
MKFFAIIAIAVAVVAVASRVAVEASPVLDRRAHQRRMLGSLPIVGGMMGGNGGGIQVKNVLVQDPLVPMSFKSLFLGTTTKISTRSFNHLLNKHVVF